MSRRYPSTHIIPAASQAIDPAIGTSYRAPGGVNSAVESTLNTSDDDVALLNEFNVDGAYASEILGFDDDDDESVDEEGCADLESEVDSETESQVISSTSFSDFQRRTRVEETRRAEQNRRAGGIKTQNGVVKAWQVRCWLIFYSPERLLFFSSRNF